MVYVVEYETNAATVTTSATGMATVTATKLSQIVAAVVTTPGYAPANVTVSGQNISFQLYQSAGTTSALAKPSAAVSFDPGTITILEVGN